MEKKDFKNVMQGLFGSSELDELDENGEYESYEGEDYEEGEAESAEEGYEAPAFMSREAESPVTYIAPGTVVEGNLRSSGDVDIAGDIVGDVVSDGSVVIRKSIKGNVNAVNLNVINCHMEGDIAVEKHVYLNEESTIDGNVEGEDVTVSGRINGNITVKGNLTLDERARVVGDVKVGTLTMARGAVIKGRLDMGE